MHVVSVNIGRPQIVVRGGMQYSTAINRRPAARPVELTLDGFTGDRVSDSRVHGGPDKAACIFPHDHYAYFSDRLGNPIAIPSFGENLTTSGWLEEHAFIGDTLRIGGATVQITQPRQPCAKLARKHDTAQLPAWINDKAWTGFYIRVLTPGVVADGDAIELLERAPNSMSVAQATRAMRSEPADRAALLRLRDVPLLSAAWKRQVGQRLVPDPEGRTDE